eukprot:11149177-Alexandrium_andersonii.AAC.1
MDFAVFMMRTMPSANSRSATLQMGVRTAGFSSEKSLTTLVIRSDRALVNSWGGEVCTPAVFPCAAFARS